MLKRSLKRSFVLFAVCGALFQTSTFADGEVDDKKTSTQLGPVAPDNSPDIDISVGPDWLFNNNSNDSTSTWLTDQDGRYVYVDGKPVMNNGRFEVTPIGGGQYTVTDNKEKLSILPGRVTSKEETPPLVLLPYEGTSSTPFSFGDQDPGTTSPSVRDECSKAGASGGSVPAAGADSSGCIQSFISGSEEAGRTTNAMTGCSDPNFVGPPSPQCVESRNAMNPEGEDTRGISFFDNSDDETDEKSDEEEKLEESEVEESNTDESDVVSSDDKSDDETSNNDKNDEKSDGDEDSESDKEDSPVSIADADTVATTPEMDEQFLRDNPEVAAMLRAEKKKKAEAEAEKERKKKEAAEAISQAEEDAKREKEAAREAKKKNEEADREDNEDKDSEIVDTVQSQSDDGDSTDPIADNGSDEGDEDDKRDPVEEPVEEPKDESFFDGDFDPEADDEDDADEFENTSRQDNAVDDIFGDPNEIDYDSEDTIGLPSADEASENVDRNTTANTGVSAVDEETGEVLVEEEIIIGNALLEAQLEIEREEFVDTGSITKIKKNGQEMGTTISTKSDSNKDILVNETSMSVADIMEKYQHIYQDEAVLRNKINRCKTLKTVQSKKVSISECIREDIDAFGGLLIQE